MVDADFGLAAESMRRDADQHGPFGGRVFLEAEAAKLPAPGLSDRRRAVLDMLAAGCGTPPPWAA